MSVGWVGDVTRITIMNISVLFLAAQAYEIVFCLIPSKFRMVLRDSMAQNNFQTRRTSVLQHAKFSVGKNGRH